MINLIKKYKYIYVFLITISIIGFISGNLYFEIQPQNIKSDIKEKIDIKENLNSRANNIPKNIKKQKSIIVNTILIIPSLINLISLFYNAFETGFIFNVLSEYNKKISIFYTTIYQIIPFIFYLILIRISFSFIQNMIKKIFYKSKKTINISKNIKKYILISFLSLLYEILIIAISPLINTYLLSIL